MVKRKLPTFAETTKKVHVKVNNKVVQVKEEKKLMTKFIIASRKWEDIDLPYCFGTYKFSVIPRSLFRPDGTMLLDTDKSAVMHEIEKTIESDRGNNVDLNILETNSVPNIAIFDGMTLVNRIKKDVRVTTCKDLAKTLTRVAHHESDEYDEVRLIFDHYQENLIKDQTRNKHTQGNQTRYKITNDTNLHGVTIKKLLSHVLAKQDVTEILGNHLEQHFRLMETRYIFLQSKIPCGRKFLQILFSRFPHKNAKLNSAKMKKYPSSYKNLTFLKKTYKSSISFAKLNFFKFDLFDTFHHKNKFREKF